VHGDRRIYRDVLRALFSKDWLDVARRGKEDGRVTHTWGKQE